MLSREELLNNIKLLENIGKYKIRYIMYSILKLVGLFFTILEPFLWANTINSIYKNDIIDSYKSVAILFLCYLLNIVISYILNITTNSIKNNMISDLKVSMMSALLHFKTSIFDSTQKGEFVSKFHSDVVAISDFIVDYISSTFVQLVQVLIIGIIIAKVDFSLMLSLLVGSLLISFIFIFYGNKIRIQYSEFRKIADKYFSNMYETLNNIREIKNLGVREQSLKKSSSLFKTIREKEIKYNKLIATSEILTNIIEKCVITSVLLWSVYLVYTKNMSVEKFIVFFSYSSQFSSCLKDISKLNSKIQSTSISFKRVYKILYDHHNFENKITNGNQINRVKDITISNLSFSYLSDNKIIDNVSMFFKENTITAIVGSSGNGKSTILHILNRLYDGYLGNVQINGIDLKLISEQSLRENVTRVFQEPLLFHGSILDNFKFVNEQLSEEEIIRCCKKAYIHEFIMSLPGGYDYVINENAINISTGQKQRLAIARALVKGANVFLFDEITSALDNEAQEYIKLTLSALRNNNCIIIVSHNISSIIDSDVIYVIDNGKVVGEGTHNELLKTCQAYINLYELESVNKN